MWNLVGFDLRFVFSLAHDLCGTIPPPTLVPSNCIFCTYVGKSWPMTAIAPNSACQISKRDVGFGGGWSHEVMLCKVWWGETGLSLFYCWDMPCLCLLQHRHGKWFLTLFNKRELLQSWKYDTIDAYSSAIVTYKFRMSHSGCLKILLASVESYICPFSFQNDPICVLLNRVHLETNLLYVAEKIL